MLILPPLTDHPLHVADLPVGGRRIQVFADRPARGLTRLLLTGPDGHSCGDALLHHDTRTATVTLTVTVPADRPTAGPNTAGRNTDGPNTAGPNTDDPNTDDPIAVIGAIARLLQHDRTAER